MKLLKQMLSLQPRALLMWDNICRRKRIKNLSNCLYFSLEYCFILFEDDGFRLICKGMDHVIVTHHQTLPAAENAFELLYLDQVLVPCRPVWSPAYYVFNSWLKKHLQEIKTLTGNGGILP